MKLYFTFFAAIFCSAFALNGQFQSNLLDIIPLPYPEEMEQPAQKKTSYQIPFDLPNDSLMHNAAIEHIFYSFLRFDAARPSVLKVAVDQRTPDPKNFIQKRLLHQVLEGKLKAYHILVKDFGLEMNKRSPNFNYSAYDNFYYANYNERAPISKADLLKYISKFYNESGQWNIDFNNLTEQQIVFLLGDEAQLSLIKKTFWHPTRNQLVSFVTGAVLQFPAKMSEDSPKTDLPYLGEPIYIPLNEPSLSDFNCLDLNAPAFSWVAQLDQMAYFEQNDMEYSGAHFSFCPIKGKTFDFLEERIVKPVLNGKVKIFKDRATYEAKGKPEGKKFLNASMHLTSVDTVLTFDPETYNEIKKVVTNEIFDFKTCQRFKLLERVYFDEEKLRFLSVVDLMAPSYDVKDDDGNYRFTRPVFWIHWKGTNCGDK